MSLVTRPPVFAGLNKYIAWLCISLQLFPSALTLSLVYSQAVNAQQQHMLPQNADQNSEDMTDNAFEKMLTSGAVAFGTALSDEDRASSEALSDYARSQVSGKLNSSVEGWLNQFGTVRSQISLDKHGRLSDSSVDWLIPYYDSPKNMLFAQLGARHKDDRNTINIGLGARFFPSDKWMYGINSFIDSDITGRNYRLGMGAEAWGDYLKISANKYQRLSSWHQSRDLADYDERPANGFDLRANGFLPSYPQLGGSLVYEQYFGDEVALFSQDNRQQDPYAVTVGANYTPIPMLTFSAEQRMGKSNQSEFTVALALTYQLDKTWRENTDPDAVDALRKLSRSRYDFVERNNDIVLEYRKQQVIRLTVSPTNVAGESGSSQNIALHVNSKYGVKSINWQGDSFIAAGGKIRMLDATHAALTLPAWQVAQLAQSTKATAQDNASRLLNTYVLTAVAQDNQGNTSSESQLNVEVLPPKAQFAGDAVVDGDYAPPDGMTPVNVQYQAVDGSQQPLKGEAVTFVVTFADGSTEKQVHNTDDRGLVSIDVTSTIAGEATVTASLSSGEARKVSIHYVDGKPDAAHSSLTASPLSIAANGSAFSTLMLALNDSQSRPVSGLSSLSFTLSGVANATLTAVQEIEPGHYSARLSGSEAGIATVTPTVDGTALSELQAKITLIGDEASAQIATGDLTVLTDNAAADGSSQNKVQIRATDAQGNPLSGQTIELSADNGASIAATAVTDNQGLAVATLTSQTAGLLTVTATLKGSHQQVQVNFVADEQTAQIADDDFSIVTDNAVANLSDQNIVRARVSDRFGNALANQTVSFSADNGATIAATGISDEQGLVNMPLISHVAGPVKVTATLNDSSQTVTVTFTGDTDTAKIADGGLTLLKDNAVTNGSDNNRVEAKVVDANGNALQGVSVKFSAENGAAILSPVVSNSDGLAITTLNNTKAGISKVTASVGGSQQSIDTHFVADTSSGKGVLAATADKAVANGSARNSVTLTLTDAHDNPLADIPVALTASNQAMLSANSGKTSAAGTLTADVSSKTAGVSTVTATLPDNQTFKVDVTFVADSDTVRVATGDLTVVRNDAIADGVASNQVQVRATDANGNSVAGQMVNFTATNGASIPTSGITGTDGTLKMLVTSVTAGSSTVIASVNGSSQSVVLNFVADDNSARIASGALTVSQNNAVANGTAVNSVQARVSDAHGNPVAGALVAFSAGNGATIVPQGTTDNNGLVSVNLSSKKAGVSTVTATVNGSSQQIDTTFVADGGTAQIGSGDLAVVADNAIADGTAANQVQVQVSDANGNPVANQSVSFGASNGATIAASGNTDTTGKVQMPVTSLK
ncbi:Ig-like domain-containing protein, partial [Scandinavium sp. NPDC088450]|uniref:Ig-like domain-containing protein n=1 Tax=Scandinavium sp. NPDC088450 TaxID=3364514 RepID=UPI00384C40F6